MARACGAGSPSKLNDNPAGTTTCNVTLLNNAMVLFEMNTHAIVRSTPAIAN